MATASNKTPFWKHPETKEKQRVALYKFGFFTFKSRTDDENEVRDKFFKTINLLVD